MTFEEWWKQYFRPGPEGSLSTSYGTAKDAWQASKAAMKERCLPYMGHKVGCGLSGIGPGAESTIAYECRFCGHDVKYSEKLACPHPQKGCTCGYEQVVGD